MNINITILDLSNQRVKTDRGGYQRLDVSYKDNREGKVAKKAIMDFSAKNVFAALSQAEVGQTFEIEMIKNEKSGYWDWTGATRADKAATDAAAPTTKPSAAPRSTYETPEERAQRQVYIVRQSSISAAVASLSVGSKAPLSAPDVIERAREYEAYVFGTEPAVDRGPTGFDDLPDGFPDVS